MKKPNLTICIVHHRKLPQLKKTVAALKQNTSVPFNLRILNNGYEAGGIRDYLETLQEKNRKTVTVVFSPENIGCSPGRNVLTKNIQTDYIMMLDDDMYVNKNWDKPLWKIFKNDPNVGAVGFSFYRVDGTFWSTGGRNLNIVGNTVYISDLNINPDLTTQKTVEVDDVAAGAMVYKRELLSIIPWDKKYFIGFEDLEKGLYLKKSKYKCVVSIQSKFIHDKVSEDPTAKAYNESRRNYHAYRQSYLHFMKKNNLRLPLFRHVFYKYICLLPPNLLRNFSYFWLRNK